MIERRGVFVLACLFQLVPRLGRRPDEARTKPLAPRSSPRGVAVFQQKNFSVRNQSTSQAGWRRLALRIVFFVNPYPICREGKLTLSLGRIGKSESFT